MIQCFPVGVTEEEGLMEARELMIERGNRELDKAKRFSQDPERKAMALGCARTAGMIFRQLGAGFEAELQRARDLVDELEAAVAAEKAKAYEEDLARVRGAALAYGLGTAEQIAEEKIGRLQEGLWIEFQRREMLESWDKVGETARRNMDPGLALSVDALVKRLRAAAEVKDVTIGEVWKVFGQEARSRWVVKITIVTTWGKRSFMVGF